MRKLALAVISAMILTLTGPLTSPAQAGVGFTQVGVERQFKKFTLYYRRSCPSCKSTWYPPSSEGNAVKTATGKAVVRVTTYKIKEQNTRRDLYAIDVDVSVSDRRGDEDWGWMDMRIQSIGRTKIYDATHSSGVGATNKDTKSEYPISVGVGGFGLSAGTTIAKFVSKSKGSSLVRSSASRGMQWRINRVNGVYHATAARFVRVYQGKTPRFRVMAQANKDGAKIACQTWSDGYHCFVPRGYTNKTVEIGTRRYS